MNTQPETVAGPAPANSSTEDKTVAILSYLTIIGFVIALVLHNGRKTRLGAFHLRQSLGLIIASIVLIPVGMILAFIPVLGWLADIALWLGLLAFWLIGLLSAINGTEKPVPVLGEKFQRWFAATFTA